MGFDANKIDGETIESYIWRLGQAKDNGSFIGSWDDITELINDSFPDAETFGSSSSYRRAYQGAKRFFEAGIFDDLSQNKYIDDIKKAKIDLEKEKVMVRDERNEYRKDIREQARRDYYKSQLADAVANAVTIPLEYDEHKQFDGVIKSDNDLLISLTDLHAGLEINSFFNNFDENVLKKRINQYLDKIFEVFVRHCSQSAYVVIGEVCSGIIHNSLRIENNMNLVEQFLMVVDYISEFIAELSYRFEDVHVYVTPGNHSRITPKKEESLRGENMDFLIIPYLSAKLQNFSNAHFHTNSVDEYTAWFNIRNTKVASVHGDRDDINSVVQRLTMYFSIKPDIVLMGHKHTNALSTVYDSKVIQAGCLSGSGDNYTKDSKLKNRPEQIIAVINNNGLDCLYDVKF